MRVGLMHAYIEVGFVTVLLSPPTDGITDQLSGVTGREVIGRGIIGLEPAIGARIQAFC